MENPQGQPNTESATIAGRSAGVGWPAVCLAVAVATPAFFPSLALVFSFLGFDNLDEQACLLSPSVAISDEGLDDTVNDIRLRRILEKQGNVRQVGSFRLSGPSEIRLDPFVAAVQAAEVACIERLGTIYFYPRIVLQGMGNAEGSFRNFLRLSVDPGRDDPERVIAHELAHLHLLWAFLPGLPVDCPRWFNEGMAEELSMTLTPDSVAERQNTLFPNEELLTFDQLSYGFSREWKWVDRQSLEAIRLLRKRFGDAEIFRLVQGLRFARSFKTVFKLTFGISLERFQADHLADMAARYNPESLPASAVVKRLVWLVGNHPGIRTIDLVKRFEPFLGTDTTNKLLEKASLTQAKICIWKGRYREAVGRLIPLMRSGNTEAISEMARVRAVVAGERMHPDAQLPRPDRQEKIGWLFSLAGCASIMALYLKLRKMLIEGFSIFWRRRTGRALAIRWISLLLVGFGSAWFFRIVVVGFIPYAGLGNLDDFARIILAEGLVVLAWSGISRQFARFDRIGGKTGTPTPETNGQRVYPVNLQSETHLGFQGSGADSLAWVALILSGWLPAILAAESGKWTPTHIPFKELTIVILVNIAASAAFFELFCGAAIRWSKPFQEGSTWWPALAYALFRGGIGADPGGWVFAFILGTILCGNAIREGKFLPALKLDLVFMAPYVIFVEGWFPSQDPVGGAFMGAQPILNHWLIPIAVVAAAAWWRTRGQPMRPTPGRIYMSTGSGSFL